MGQGESDALIDEFIAADVAGVSFGVDLGQNIRGDPHGDHFFLGLSGHKFLQNHHLPFLKIIFDML